MLGFGKKKEPTADEIIRMERNAQIEARGVSGGDAVYGARQIPDGISFDYQVIDDENMLRIFELNPWLDSYYPDFSRLNFLTNISPQEAKLAAMRVRRALTRLKYTRTSLEDRRLCESLIRYQARRIWDSVKGYKLTTLSTTRKHLRLTETKEKSGILR
ncbi:MAG: hypothetical protein KAV41_03495 [Candidatus Pacebacteria bacterium]|nr:hypothetical protein [Candidatus Paceibacterota bacterium]